MDFLKVLAAIFITNSHFIPLYKDISPSLATFGVHGNALFFFVSGFVLMMGFEKKKIYLLIGIRKEYKDYGLLFFYGVLLPPLFGKIPSRGKTY